MTRVTKHAVVNYIRRVFNEDPDLASVDTYRDAELEIVKAVYNPDEVVHNIEDKPQVHIRNGAAVIVGEEDASKGYTSNGNPKLVPYDNLKGYLIVPTVYTEGWIKNSKHANGNN